MLSPWYKLGSPLEALWQITVSTSFSERPFNTESGSSTSNKLSD